MKGIAHFISGVAAASCCPWAVEAASNGNPLYFIVGAVGGILPDTIDFKFYRYFYRCEVLIEPDPENLDPQPVAEQIAVAIDDAFNGSAVRVKLSTLQSGADRWRQYRVRIDGEAGLVNVQFGPLVSTGRQSYAETLPTNRPVGTALLQVPICKTDQPVYTVDIFDGPVFSFERDESGRVKTEFLPWHRLWSHSVFTGLLFGGLIALADWRAGAVFCGAYGLHLLEDQAGHMGSNLFFPFLRRRQPGLKWMHSGDALPNFAAVWFCCLLIFWNLYRAIPDPRYEISFLQLLLAAMVIPFGLIGSALWWLQKTAGPEEPAVNWDL